MIREILKVRTQQLSRSLVGIGIFRSLFLLGIVATTAIFMFAYASDPLFAFLMAVAIPVALALIQIKRKDKLFLRTHFKNYKQVLWIEYLTLSIPLIFCLLYHFNWKPVVILIAGVSVLPFLNGSINALSINTKLQEWIPHDSFEWKAGVRQQFLILVPLWVVALFTSWFIGSVPIAIFFLGIICFKFYEESEPVPMLMLYELNPAKLIKHKIKKQLSIYFIIIAPLLICFWFFQYEYWYIPLGELVILVSLQVYIILTKYAYYDPGQKSPAAQTMGSIGFLGGIIPVFLPGVWALSVWFYFRAVKNLNDYLHDYNN